MERLEDELDRARELDPDALADAIEAIGFECTRCGACCKGYAPDETAGADERADASDADREPHTATVFPDEVRTLVDAANETPAAGERGDADPSESDAEAYDWRDVARPMPYGLTEDEDGERTGETFEWAIQTDACGDCTFYREAGGPDGGGACAVHEDRPLICRTYPFSVALGGTSQPMGEAVDAEGMVRAHECEGLGRDISRGEAEELATALKERAVREIEEAIAVRDNYDPTVAVGAEADADTGADAAVVVHDSEGQKRADGTPIDPDA
ncbi:YkgJ family cysteine cluster protein [Haloparvum alkalitolerans]|uniref:YkgJ family cysteine cluster protein n=1 Tax=Haloparvum alkalitolerans TaxID=1042953 RepID=UPI003CF43653